MSVAVIVMCDYDSGGCQNTYQTALHEAHNDWRDYDYLEFEEREGWLISIAPDPKHTYVRCPEHRKVI